MFFRRKRESVQPEWVIVGLGNPGGQYEGTRHNVGFEVIRRLSARHNLRLSERKYQANFGVGTMRDRTVALVRPLTYMNRSGIAVAALLDWWKLPPERMVVVFDDMDLEVGRVLIKPFGGPGTHNGMKDIIARLRTEQFPRVRIGIGKPPIAGADYVLSPFRDEEIPLIQEALDLATDGCEWIVTEGVDKAMNRVNSVRKGE
ncbi:MAG: peptidyl-tRNA hydrolase [Fimbriimonadales bacterium]|nr:MAG: peptidyl-tRNA hydrolase [Fimbriimonadales bacterium]